MACKCSCCTGCTSVGCKPVDACIDGIAIGGRILAQIALDQGLLAIDVLSLTVAGDGSVMLTKAYWKLIKSVSIGVLVLKIIY